MPEGWSVRPKCVARIDMTNKVYCGGRMHVCLFELFRFGFSNVTKPTNSLCGQNRTLNIAPGGGPTHTCSKHFALKF
jgi:hypothetical protein